MTWITRPMKSLDDETWRDNLFRCDYCAAEGRGAYPDDWHEVFTRTPPAPGEARPLLARRIHICPGHVVSVDGKPVLAMNRPKPEGA